MTISTAKPCNECPFVLGRTKGYIGRYSSGHELHSVVTLDGVFPCHKGLGTDQETNCRGAAIYRKAIGKRCQSTYIQKVEDAVVAANPDEKPVPPFKLEEYHNG